MTQEAPIANPTASAVQLKMWVNAWNHDVVWRSIAFLFST